MLWASEKAWEKRSTFQTLRATCVLACNPDILNVGRMEWANWSLALDRSSLNVRHRSSDGGRAEFEVTSGQQPRGPVVTGKRVLPGAGTQGPGGALSWAAVLG